MFLEAGTYLDSLYIGEAGRSELPIKIVCQSRNEACLIDGEQKRRYGVYSKGFGNIVVGNIIGSNIANIFLIMGIAGIISPLSIIKSTIFVSAPFMIFITLLFLFFIWSRWQIERIEAIIFLLLYAAFLSYMFVYGSKII